MWLIMLDLLDVIVLVMFIVLHTLFLISLFEKEEGCVNFAPDYDPEIGLIPEH
jgi:hypothetical protein